MRIIGGQWRRTRIELAPGAELRPSADRTRETVFNWLAPDLSGAKCLDLFAGSGAFAFEAVSRGAAGAVAIERDAAAYANLAALKARLGAEMIEIHHADALAWLDGPATPFDLVFLDPPFDSDLLMPALQRLAHGWLGDDALVYIESSRDGFKAPDDWHAVHCAKTRHVSYALLRRSR